MKERPGLQSGLGKGRSYGAKIPRLAFGLQKGRSYGAEIHNHKYYFYKQDAPT
jgi:hypothetical protein